jgi:GH25 family lysozyme M1 (1,4-beta-N-acetylmuramidase)
LFGFYVFQLNRLNDQFEKRLRNGRMEPSLFNFETNYTEIFGDWMASGVEKSIQELYRDLVLRIVFLNNQFPHNPTFNQIVEYTTKCERAYDIIEGLDRKVKDLHKDGCLVITRALRLLRCIVGSGAFKATPGLSGAAEASFATPVTEGSRVSQPVSFSAWAKSNLRDPHLDQEKVLNTTRTKVTHNPPDESKARPKRAWMKHLSSWIVLGLLFLLLIYSGYALRKYHDRESTVENSFAGVSHPPVDCAQGIHDFKQHYDLLKPRLDSAHRLMKLDTLINLLANPKLDSVEIHAIKAHMDSLKSGHDHANGPDLMYGIDVSFWQKKIDWKRVANDPSGPKPIHFAILRATYGLNKDLRFDTNWSSAKEHIPVIGAYHFLHFLDDPIQQANLFILSAPLIQGNMRPILDIETNCQDCDPTMGLTKDELVQHVRDFLKVIEAHYNTKAIIYSNKYFYDTYLKDQFPAHDFWLAEHNGERSVEKVMEAYRNPPDQEIPVMWQFSATGKISGIAPKLNVDLNFLKSTYVERIIIN